MKVFKQFSFGGVNYSILESKAIEDEYYLIETEKDIAIASGNLYEIIRKIMLRFEGFLWEN